MDDALRMLQALADPSRYEIFSCLRGCGDQATYDPATGQCDGGQTEGVALCDVPCQLDCSPSTLSHHVGVLRDAGLIESDRRGRKLYLKIRPEALRTLDRALLRPSTQAGCASPKEER